MNTPPSEILLYQTEDQQTRVQVRLEGDTVWLTQAQMADLFQTTPQNITLHLKAVFTEGELNEMAICKDYLQVRKEGGREVSRSLRHYNPSLTRRPHPCRSGFNPTNTLPKMRNVGLKPDLRNHEVCA